MIEDKLRLLLNTKKSIKEALIDKGLIVDDSDTFRSYAEKINSISGNNNLLSSQIISASTTHNIIGAEGKKVIASFYARESGASPQSYLEPIVFTNCDSQLMGRMMTGSSRLYGSQYVLTNITGTIIISCKRSARLSYHIIGD